MSEPSTDQLRTAVGVLLSIVKVIMPEHAPCHHDRRWLLSVLDDVAVASAASAASARPTVEQLAEALHEEGVGCLRWRSGPRWRQADEVNHRGAATAILTALDRAAAAPVLMVREGGPEPSVDGYHPGYLAAKMAGADGLNDAIATLTHIRDDADHRLRALDRAAAGPTVRWESVSGPGIVDVQPDNLRPDRAAVGTEASASKVAHPHCPECGNDIVHSEGCSRA